MKTAQSGRGLLSLPRADGNSMRSHKLKRVVRLLDLSHRGLCFTVYIEISRKWSFEECHFCVILVL